VTARAVRKESKTASKALLAKTGKTLMYYNTGSYILFD
jgi:hypothetical protein